MIYDETTRLAADIFTQVTAGRILRDGTTSTHSPHDASAALEAAKAFMRIAADHDLSITDLERRQQATSGFIGSAAVAP